MKCSLDNPETYPLHVKLQLQNKMKYIKDFFIYFLVLWDCDAQNQEIYFFEICIQTKCSLYADLQDATNIENAFMRVARELKSRYENGSQLQANIMDDAVILESRSVDSKWCGCG